MKTLCAGEIQNILEPFNWAIRMYRFSRWRNKIKCDILRKSLGVVETTLKVILNCTTNVRISSSSKVGKNLVIYHPGCIVVGPHVVIGDRCGIGGSVTMGHRRYGFGNNEKQKLGSPVLGNDVYIGPNVGIYGGIRIGHRVTIAPGAIVIKDIPDDCIVVGMSRVIKDPALL